MQSRYFALFAGLAVVAVSLAIVAVSSGSPDPLPVVTLEMERGMPMLAVYPAGKDAELVEPAGMLRRGPEAWSSNRQMQMLTCFGICGPECQAHCETNYQQCVRVRVTFICRSKDAIFPQFLPLVPSQPPVASSIDSCPNHCRRHSLSFALSLSLSHTYTLCFPSSLPPSLHHLTPLCTSTFLPSSFSTLDKSPTKTPPLQYDKSQLQYYNVDAHFTMEPDTHQPNWCRATLDRCKGQCS